MTQFMSNSLFFGAAISLIAYEAGLLLKRKFKMAIFNPLLIAIIAVIAVLCLLHIDYDTYNQSGQYISYLLTPATVCLAVPLYQQMELLKKNLKAVIIGIVSGVLASLVSVLILAKLFSLSHEQYVTLLPKSITTAIGMGVSEELGGIVTITVAVIIITGVLGNMIAETVIKLARIEEPIAKGLALGTSAHAIGTAKAMELGEIEGAMSSLAIAVAGLLTAAAVAGSLLSVPVAGSKCAPVQHMVNILAAVTLGPAWGVGIAFCASLLRNLLGLGSLMAFPGSMVGALCCGLVYKKCHILSLTCLAEAIGTGFLGALAAYPVALYLMGIAPAGLFVYVVPFLISTVAGSILAFILITVLEKGGVMSQIKEA